MFDIKFDSNNRLYIANQCQLCFEYQLEDLNNSCVQCGWTQGEIIELESKIDRVNKAIDMMNKYGNGDDIVISQEVYVALARMNVDSTDSIVLEDVDNTKDLRAISPYIGKMATVVFYPSDEDADVGGYVQTYGIDDIYDDDDDE